MSGKSSRGEQERTQRETGGRVSRPEAGGCRSQRVCPLAENIDHKGMTVKTGPDSASCELQSFCVQGLPDRLGNLRGHHPEHVRNALPQRQFLPQTNLGVRPPNVVNRRHRQGGESARKRLHELVFLEGGNRDIGL